MTSYEYATEKILIIASLEIKIFYLTLNVISTSYHDTLIYYIGFLCIQYTRSLSCIRWIWCLFIIYIYIYIYCFNFRLRSFQREEACYVLEYSVPKCYLYDSAYVQYVVKVKVRVKQFLYRPGQTLRVPRGWGARISRQSAHEGGNVVSPTHRPPLHPRK
jgi:hypothetical protein